MVRVVVFTDLQMMRKDNELCQIMAKSTVLKLLNRLYDPTEGSIIVNNHDIRTLKLADLRRCTFMLFQDYTHFPLSVYPFPLSF